ncbi:MAG TPA: hypothetical protein VKP30_27955, partial [Polyangiaceae bacterium]|nr:hypothetical protein [Polyangiaceae bacterium]
MPLSRRTVQYASSACSDFSTGTYRNIRNTTNDGATVYLAQGLKHGAYDCGSDTNTYIWNVRAGPLKVRVTTRAPISLIPVAKALKPKRAERP